MIARMDQGLSQFLRTLLLGEHSVRIRSHGSNTIRNSNEFQGICLFLFIIQFLETLDSNVFHFRKTPVKCCYHNSQFLAEGVGIEYGT